MTGIQFSWPSNIPNGRIHPENFLDDCSFRRSSSFEIYKPKCKEMGSPHYSAFLYVSIFLRQLWCQMNWTTRLRKFCAWILQLRMAIGPIKLEPDHTLRSTSAIHQELAWCSERRCCLQLSQYLGSREQLANHRLPPTAPNRRQILLCFQVADSRGTSD